MPVTPDWIERYLADETEPYRDPDMAGLDPPLAALIQEKLRGGLARLNAVPESDPFWKGTNGDPTFGKLYEYLESALALNPGDEEARWILFALGLHYGDNDSWLKSLGPLAENDPRLLRWLVAAGRFIFLRTGHNPGASLRDFLKRLAKKVPGTRGQIDRMEDDPDAHVRKMASLATALLQDEDALLGEAEEFRPMQEPAEARDVAMKAVYSTGDPAEAATLLAILRTRGIECFLENEGGAMYAMGIPSPAIPLVLSVPDGDADRAVALIKETRKSPEAQARPAPAEGGGKSPAGEGPQALPQEVSRTRRKNRIAWNIVACVLVPFVIPFVLLKSYKSRLRFLVGLAITCAILVWMLHAPDLKDPTVAIFSFVMAASIISTALAIYLDARRRKSPPNP